MLELKKAKKKKAEAVLFQKGHHTTKTFKVLWDHVFTPQQKKLIKFKLNQYTEKYRLTHNVNPWLAADTWHDMIDRVLLEAQRENPELALQIQCHQGCNHCCHKPVSVNQAELEMMLEMARRRGLEIDLERVERQGRAGSKSWHRLPKEDKACVFLDPSGNCGVYDVRPGTCRKVLVMDDPEKCRDSYAETPKAFIVPEVEALSSASLSVGEQGLVSELILKLIGRRKK